MNEREIRKMLAEILKRLDAIEERQREQSIQTPLVLPLPPIPPIDLGGTFVYAAPGNPWIGTGGGR
jgi:hypothetical protein